jgi:hypothetical protein
VSGEPIDGLFVQQIAGRLEEARAKAVAEVTDLEESVGTDVDDLERKRGAKARLDAALAPFVRLARVWSGAAQAGTPEADVAYEAAVASLVEAAETADSLTDDSSETGAGSELARGGLEAFPLDLAFPEVFDDRDEKGPGFDATIGNPPWDAIQPLAKEFYAAYDANWGERPRYVGAIHEISERPDLLVMAQHYRLAFRDIARATDVQATVNLFILNGWPIPDARALAPIGALLSHAALRLSANHEGYAALWAEQLGDEWREDTPRGSFSVLASDEERGRLRAAIDAAVAHAYGLDRDQYAHVLGSFPHTSDREAPKRCLAAFDEHIELGVEAFCRRYDPYHDVPIPERLPEPVLQLVHPAGEPAPAPSEERFALSSPPPARPKRARNGELDPALLETLLGRFTEAGVLAARDAALVLGVDDARAAKPYLDRLLDGGSIIREGKGRGTRYRFTGERG